MDTNKSDTIQSPPGKKRVSKGAIVVLVVSMAVVLTGMWYATELKNMLKLKPWAKGAMFAAVDEAAAALESADQASIEALLPDFPVQTTDGRVTSIKAGSSPMAPFVPIAAITPGQPAADAVLQYRYGESGGNVFVYLKTTDGGRVRFSLGPDAGEWRIADIAQGAAPPGS